MCAVYELSCQEKFIHRLRLRGGIGIVKQFHPPPVEFLPILTNQAAQDFRLAMR
jgi:hypothetical protein